MDLHQAAQWLPGSTLVGEPATRVTRVHSDTRSLRSGDLFVAIRGDHHDGNLFLAQARTAGATAALAHSAEALHAAGLSGIVVPDTRLALGTLATRWREQFTPVLIAVTGSNGKTTVTQMLASILQHWVHDAALATQGNFNNDIGLPLTLLRLRSEHRIAVVELGMNHPGEIALLSAMAQPTVALVNNAQREHLEFMATVAAVARENGAVIDALAADGIAVFPHDDAFAAQWRARAGERRCLSFTIGPAPGMPCSADLRAALPVWRGDAWQVAADTPAGALQFRLHMAGVHNVHNALAAAGAAIAAGVPLAHVCAGLEAFKPVKGRSRMQYLHAGGQPVTLVDDSYNANPDSVDAALEMLAALPAPRLMVLGDMGEVGDQGPHLHVQAGEKAHALGIELLFALGELSAHACPPFPGARHFDAMPALIDAVRAQLPTVASVLVKGSRFMKMEQLIDALATGAQAANATTGESTCC